METLTRMIGMSSVSFLVTETSFSQQPLWVQAGGEVSASGVIASFISILNQAPSLSTGFIVLAHDLYQQSVDLAVGYILPDAIASTNPKFNITSIVSCLHQPLANA